MSRSGRSFFGLPGIEDEGFLQGVQAFKLAQLSEIRMAAQEAGTWSEARALPLEVRRWLVGEMRKKDGSGGGSVDQGGKRVVTREVR